MYRNDISLSHAIFSVNEPVEYEIKYQTMCGIISCEKTRKEVRMDQKIKHIYKETQTRGCCPGYAESPDRHCLPICFNSCNNGKCIGPNECKCTPEPTETSPGYVGSTCGRFACLAANRWGPKCDKECDECPANSYCSATTGKCLCRSGWRGFNCTEECDSTSNCEDVELPPVVEPEVNIISDVIGPSQKLVAMEARSLEKTNDNELSSGLSANYLFNLFLLGACVTLFVAAFLYRSRLNQVRNELYYATCSSGGSGGGSNYSSDQNSYYATNRPRMPTPQGDFLDKNLNFASATRHILNGKADETQSVKSPDNRHKFALDPRVESNLITSQQASKLNVYSQIGTDVGDRSYATITDTSNLTNNSVTLSITQDADEDHQYQVPRSPAIRANFSLPLAENGPKDVILDESNNDDDVSNIYEEIKPRKSLD